VRSLDSRGCRERFAPDRPAPEEPVVFCALLDFPRGHRGVTRDFLAEDCDLPAEAEPDDDVAVRLAFADAVEVPALPASGDLQRHLSPAASSRPQ